jgi:hypothetical protein
MKLIVSWLISYVHLKQKQAVIRNINETRETVWLYRSSDTRNACLTFDSGIAVFWYSMMMMIPCCWCFILPLLPLLFILLFLMPLLRDIYDGDILHLSICCFHSCIVTILLSFCLLLMLCIVRWFHCWHYFRAVFCCSLLLVFVTCILVPTCYSLNSCWYSSILLLWPVAEYDLIHDVLTFLWCISLCIRVGWCHWSTVVVH